MSSIVAEPSPLLSDTVRPRAVLPLEAPASRKHLWVLAAITLLGGVLRFSMMDRPLLWGDDAYTVYRTHADYQSMLDILQYDGFMPLHYELYWLMGKAAASLASNGASLTPKVVRILPALFGTAMVPGMYLLASHLVRRRTALVVALATACSAYMLGYSRDGKMYMMLWCFSAYSVGCLLWWFRTGSRVAWLAWVAASLAMTSSHLTGLALVPLELIFFLTRSKTHWKQAILLVLGLALMLLPVYGYMSQFNKWTEQVEDFGFEVEGLGWVVELNRGRTGDDLLKYQTSAYLFSWEWPKEQNLEKLRPWILTGFSTAMVCLLLLAGVGSMPWRRRHAGLVPEDSPPQPWWRVALWLGLWMVVPTYALYCRSMVDFVSPRAWIDSLALTLSGPTWRDDSGAVNHLFWYFLAAAMLLVGAAIFASIRVRQGLITLVPIGAGAMVLVAIVRSGLPKEWLHGGDWVVYFGKPLQAWFDLLTQSVSLTVLAVILPGLILYYCAPTWPGRAVRVAQMLLVAGVIYAACWGMFQFISAKYEKELGRAIARNPGANIKAIKAALAQKEWASIYIPRYIGFVWIAFCIALVSLLMRLPSRGLRIAAVGLFITINLAQFGARIFASTEPPLDRVAHDIWLHDTHNTKSDLTGRVYVNDAVAGAGHPGNGTLAGQQGKYYLGLERGFWIAPKEWKRVDPTTYFDIRYPRAGRDRTAGLDYSAIAADVRRNPQIQTVIIWEKLAAENPDPADHFLPLAGGGWEKVSQSDQVVRFHWEWRDLYTYRRCEYRRRVGT